MAEAAFDLVAELEHVIAAFEAAHVDMSREAIMRRFESVRAMYKLGISLSSIPLDKARPVTPRTP